MQKNKARQFHKSLLLLGLMCLTYLSCLSQEESLSDIFKVDYDTPLTLDLDEKKEDESVPERKKKVKKNVFFGFKTKKGFARTGYRNDVIIELFHFLKKYQRPAEYAREFYWYDAKKKKLMNSLQVNEDNALVLHGPYKKTLLKSGQVIEEGWFFMGMKHKRWVRFNKHDILQEKKYWWKGWPQESRLAYYDFKKTRLREVIPVHYTERNGEYWAFHEDGSVAVRGKYKFDERVGLWREYYPKRKIKREVVYPDDPFNFEFRPYINKEWDKKGTLIYDHKNFLNGHG